MILSEGWNESRIKSGIDASIVFFSPPRCRCSHAALCPVAVDLFLPVWSASLETPGWQVQNATSLVGALRSCFFQHCEPPTATVGSRMDRTTW